jgi:F420-0:gamma-glutamyl ligase-like protein
MTSMRFGKYRGVDIRTVPIEYLEFILRQSEKSARDIREEIARREMAEGADLSWMQRIIETGYRELSRRFHPDLNDGIGVQDIQQINAAVAALRQATR